MGVTYKLKQEVIDLIVQKKRADPSLSCRKLVDLLYQAFQIDVSKSSVNAVIKEFDLSNPVGRRSGKAPKNFIIPPERKQQLLAQVTPFLPEAAVPAVPVEEVIQPVVAQQQTENKIPEEPPLEEQIVEEVVEEAVHLAPDPIAPVLKQLVKEKIDWSDEQGPLLENMGFFFVYAFMQDILRRPLLGHVLSFAAGMEQEESRPLEAAIFPKGVGYPSLAAMFEEDPKKIEDLLVRFFGKDMSLTALSVAFETELSTAFVQGSFLKCIADTGKSFCLSADLCALLAGPDGGWRAPMFKAIERAADLFLVGQKPLVFHLGQGFDPAAQEFLSLLGGMSQDKLDRIELWSEQGNNVWSFVLKAGRKHRFVASICGREPYDNISMRASVADLYEDLAFGEQYELEEGVYVVDEVKDLKFRAVLVGKRSEVEKMVLLTDITEKELKKEDIFEYYLENNGFTTISHHNKVRNDIESHVFMGDVLKENNLCEKEHNLEGILNYVFKCFEKYTLKSLFEDVANNDVIQAIYPLAARIRYQKSHVHIRFEIEKTFAHFVALQTAVARANCFCIRDYLGRRISFSLLTSFDK